MQRPGAGRERGTQKEAEEGGRGLLQWRKPSTAGKESQGSVTLDNRNVDASRSIRGPESKSLPSEKRAGSASNPESLDSPCCA